MDNDRPATGPLSGVRALEIGGIGPVPFCGMLLADMGAEVIRFAPPGVDSAPTAVTHRGKHLLPVDLKHPDAREFVLRLVAGTDLVYEGFRPGVAERLGIGPEPCLDANRALVYGRMSGWGQDGPLATTAGHDIDFIAVAGALHPIGPADAPPPPPLNLLGDYGGGATLLALGLLAALLSSRATGVGQVVDAAMVDGTALLTAGLHAKLAAGTWHPGRASNAIDGSAPYYTTYECADGSYLAVGALEPAFSAQLLDGLGFAPDDPIRRAWYEPSAWPESRRAVAERVRTRTRDEWCSIFDGTDACVAPVLSPAEAARHPRNTQRHVFVEREGVVQPAPAPRFSATPSAAGPVATGRSIRDAASLLEGRGWSAAEIEALAAAGVFG